MTSPATDNDTREFFQQRQYFGLQPSQIVFFSQVCEAAVNGLLGFLVLKKLYLRGLFYRSLFTLPVPEGLKVTGCKRMNVVWGVSWAGHAALPDRGWAGHPGGARQGCQGARRQRGPVHCHAEVPLSSSRQTQRPLEVYCHPESPCLADVSCLLYDVSMTSVVMEVEQE